MTLVYEFDSTQCFGYTTYFLNWLLLHEDSDLLCHFVVRNLSIVLRLTLQASSTLKSSWYFLINCICDLPVVEDKVAHSYFVVKKTFPPLVVLHLGVFL